MISDQLRFVFVHLPRTGGTSVETALAPWSRDPVGYAAEGNTVLPHKHASAAELQALLGEAWSSYLRFTVVRDPWARMLSDYHFFRETGPKLLARFTPRERALTADALALDFDAWLARNAETLRPCQLEALTDAEGELLVNRVLRLERLSADFAALCAELGVRVPLPRKNASRRPPVALAYSPESAALIAELCRPDIERFGYRFGEAAPEHRPEPALRG
ncbi:MAG: sulfotransferase family 2 domain-containing protein [Alphaproteobacteria bacterium]|nr:sulfotransferase family 2 domain-containing protein [Alphaproteobacteria bacterium]MCB9796604.1 sulfotransferase family 2 domain-containing protein [Alphaproteobacteria bacterium]